MPSTGKTAAARDGRVRERRAWTFQMQSFDLPRCSAWRLLRQVGAYVITLSLLIAFLAVPSLPLSIGYEVQALC